MKQTNSEKQIPPPLSDLMTEFDTVAFGEALVEWFVAHQRVLPWRVDYDPYAVWVSEIMLQQTQVVTVIPYFERFLAQFPTVQALAEASEEDVMRLWSGLGYYSRARNLQRGAGEVVEQHGGQVPSEVATLLTLKGVGRYTAGAISSIAYNRPAPILDGNVMRVLSRLFALAGNPKAGPLHARLWELAEVVIPEGRSREFNSGMMELGATVCTPRSPRCGECPVSRHCKAYRSGEQERYPQTPPQRASEAVQMACAVATDSEGRVLLIQPADKGRWGGLWQLPHASVEGNEGHRERLSRFMEEIGIPGEMGASVTTLRHGITRFAITLHAFEWFATTPVEMRNSPPARWVPPYELAETPIPAPHRKVLKAWAAGQRAEMAPGRQLALDLTL